MSAEFVTHKVRPVGATFHYQKRKYHIVGTCIDKFKEGQMLVYLVRYYGKYKQWWHYEAMTAEEYDWNLQDGLLKED